MRLYDPARRRIGNLPALLPRPDFVVPRLSVWPEEAFAVRVSATIPGDTADGAFVAREVSKLIPPDDLAGIIASYYSDPENLLETLFNIRLETTPAKRPPKQVSTVVSSEDLGI